MDSLCSRCRQALTDPFFTNRAGQPVCASCQARLAIVERPNTPLTLLGAVGQAGVAAVLSGIVSAGLTWITGYSLAIVWIFLGGLVGALVRRACGRSSHVGFRLLAVAATYLGEGLSIALTAVLTMGRLGDVDGAVAWQLLTGLGLPGPLLVARRAPIMSIVYGYGLLQAWRASARGTPDFSGPLRRDEAAAWGRPDEAETLPADAASPPGEERPAAGGWSRWGALGVALWKAKAVLAGLAKLPTLLTMLGSVWAYALLWGWPFALGFVLCIYLHEMGHVLELRRLGMKFSAPIFIPGLGAQIMLRERWTDPVDDARIGLAGPNFGLISTVICWGLFHATGWGLFRDLTETSALLNLFNLVPFYPLDGGRGIRPLNRADRVWVWLAGLAAYVATENGLLILLLLAGAYHIWRCPQQTSHTPTLVNYVLLIFALTAFFAHLL